jgi:hypothetical protein
LLSGVYFTPLNCASVRACTSAILSFCLS